MRQLPIIMLVTCLIGFGCNSAQKKPPAAPANYPNAPGTPPSPFWSDTKDPKINGVSNESKPEVEGLLAGRLIDNAGQPQANALVNVTVADAGPNGKPIGIQSDDQGYFIIKGLKQGTTYFLSVRGDDHGKVLGGSVITQAPNTRLLIKLSEGNVSAITPPKAPASGADAKPPADKKEGGTKLVEPPSTSIPAPEPVKQPSGKDPLLDGSDQSWAPGKTPVISRPLPPPPPPSVRSPNVADGSVTWQPPVANIAAPPKIEAPPLSGSATMSAVPSNSSPLGDLAVQAETPRLNFTLYDFGGDAVEFSKLSDRRLIVLDFWTTNCVPCLHKIPELVSLQTRYSGYVEVVGVACDNLPFAQRKTAVDGIKRYYLHTSTPMNYKILFEGEGREVGRVQSLFKVDSYPTLILLDHSGKQLWRGRDVRQLEESISYYLKR